MQLKNLGNLLSWTFDSTNTVDKFVEGMKSLSVAQQAAILNTKNFDVAQRTALSSSLGLKMATDGQTVSTTALATAETTATGATTKLSLAWKGLAAKLGMSVTALNLAATGIAALAAGAIIYKQYQQAQEEARQAAQEAADTYVETTKSISDYTKRYEELHSALLAAKGNEEETYNVKKQLLDLQTELNDKFGDEYGKLNLVTDAYKNQTDAIRAFNKEAANRFLNETPGLDTAEKEMTKDREYFLGSTGNLNEQYAKDIYDIVSKYQDKGIKLEAFTDKNTPGYTIKFLGDATQADEVINELETEIRSLQATYRDNNFVDGIIENSKNRLIENNKIIELQGQQYKEKLDAEIQTKDSLSKQYDEATQAVQEYNEAVLKSENPYNDTNVQIAYDNIQKLKGEIQNDDSWDKYSSVINEVWDSADTKIFDLNAAIKSNEDGIGQFLDKIKGADDLDLKAKVGADDADIIYNSLDKYADKYRMSVDELIDSLVTLGYVQGQISSEATNITTPITKSDAIAKVNELSEGLESLDEIMITIKDKDKPFDYALLDNKKFKDNFEDLGDSYTDFIETISNSPKDISACQDAFDNLVTAFLNQKGITEVLNEDTKWLVSSMLENMGVANAQEVVTQQLIQKEAELAAQKVINANATFDMANATEEEIAALINEAGQSEATRAAIVDLLMAKINCNSTGIVTDGDIQNLIDLANAAGIAAEAVANAKAAASQSNKGGVARSAGAENAINNSIYNNLESGIQQDINKYKYTPVQYTGGTKTNKSGGKGSGSKKEFSDELNYIDRLLSESDKRLKWFNNELEDALTIDEKDSAITKIVNETEYQLKQMNDVYAYYSKAASDKLAQIPEAMRESVKNGAVDIESLNDENLSNLIKEFYDLDGEAEDAQDKIRDLNKSIKDMAQQRIQIRIDFLEDKNAKLNTRLDKYKAMISAVISGIEGEMDDVNKYYDRQVDKINEQIEALESQQKVYQDQLDELNKQNEALEIQKALEDALYAKRKAENNKNVRIYREGQGFVQEADQDAIKDANDQYDEAQFNKKKYDLQSQIDVFNEQIDGLNEAIDKLEKARDKEINYLQSIKDAWDDVEKSAERIANMEMADDFFGDGWFSDIMNGDSSYLDDITEKFQTTYSAISDNQQQIDSLNAIKDTLSNVDTATAMNMANMATGYTTLGNTAVTQSNNVNAATGTIPVLTEENRLLNEASMLLWGENFQTFGAQASGVADSIATSYESMASRLEAAAARAVSAIKRIKRAERDDDDDDGYAVGTKNAKPGLRRVAENGPEAITRNDGTVLLATKEQLYPFEGGEKVDTAGETTALLRPINRARLAELTATPPIADRGFTITDEMSRKVLENLSYMPTFDVPKMDYSQFAVKSQERPVTVTIGDVVLHEVDDVDKLGRAIVNRLPGVVSQGIAKK